MFVSHEEASLLLAGLTALPPDQQHIPPTIALKRRLERHLRPSWDTTQDEAIRHLATTGTWTQRALAEKFNTNQSRIQRILKHP